MKKQCQELLAEKLTKIEDNLELLMATDELEQALNAVNKLIFLNANNATYYVKRGRIYAQLGDLSSGIAHFHKALGMLYKKEWETELNTLYYVKGMTMIEEGNATDAVAFIKDLKVEDFKFTYLRAMAYIKGGNRDLALREVEACLKFEPNNVEGLVLKGKLLWSMGKQEEGNKQFWSAYEVDPANSEVKEFLAIMRPKAMQCHSKASQYFICNEYLEALAEIKKGLECYHDCAKLLLLQASILRLQGDYEKAMDSLEQAAKNMVTEGIEAEVNMQIGLTYNDMGKMLFAKEKYSGAVTVFTEAEKYLPRDPGIQINRGDSYKELGNYSLALANYHYALELNGSKALILTRLALTHYQLGIACFNKKDYNGAIVEFTRGIEFNGNSPDFFIKRGRTYIELKEFRMAYMDFTEAVKLDPQNQEALSFISQFQ